MVDVNNLSDMADVEHRYGNTADGIAAKESDQELIAAIVNTRTRAVAPVKRENTIIRTELQSVIVPGMFRELKYELLRKLKEYIKKGEKNIYIRNVGGCSAKIRDPRHKVFHQTPSGILQIALILHDTLRGTYPYLEDAIYFIKHQRKKTYSR